MPSANNYERFPMFIDEISFFLKDSNGNWNGSVRTRLYPATIHAMIETGLPVKHEIDANQYFLRVEKIVISGGLVSAFTAEKL